MSFHLCRTHLAEHCIETGDARPIRQPPRRVPMAFAGEEKEAIEQLIKQGVIQKSNSAWSSPIVLVRKKNGKVRPCIDYGRLTMSQLKTPFHYPGRPTVSMQWPEPNTSKQWRIFTHKDSPYKMYFQRTSSNTDVLTLDGTNGNAMFSGTISSTTTTNYSNSGLNEGATLRIRNDYAGYGSNIAGDAGSILISKNGGSTLFSYTITQGNSVSGVQYTVTGLTASSDYVTITIAEG